MDSGTPSRAGLRIGTRRISELPFLVLFRGFCLYGLLCLLILYAGALGVGHSRGFAYLAATEVGDVIGDSLTAEKSKISLSLRYFQVFNLQTNTNKNQKVVYSSIKRVGVHWNYHRLTGVEVDGLSCDVKAIRSGGWMPSRLDFLSRLPLVNRSALPAKLPAPKAFPSLPEDPEEAEATPATQKHFDLHRLPSLQIRDASLRLRNADGGLLAEFTGINLTWVPSVSGEDGQDRLELQAKYQLTYRAVPAMELDIAVTSKNGVYSVEKLEAEQALLLEIAPFLEQLGPQKKQPESLPPSK